MSNFIYCNGIRLHYLDYPGEEPGLLLLHGLTANAHEFDGLIRAGLSPRFYVAAPDLRGRGLSDKPPQAYSMADHSADVMCLMNALALKKAVLVGHSFGGILAIYMAAHFPGRITRLVLMDVSEAAIHPSTAELIRPSLDRLKRIYPSWPVYKQEMKKMAYLNGYWDKTIEDYFRADMEIREDGTVQSRARPELISQAFDAAIDEPWDKYIRDIKQPALLINAPSPYGPPGTPPVIPAADAQATAAKLADCRYVQVPGNHITMVFGDNAPETVKAIADFVGETR